MWEVIYIMVGEKIRLKEKCGISSWIIKEYFWNYIIKKNHQHTRVNLLISERWQLSPQKKFISIIIFYNFILSYLHILPLQLRLLVLYWMKFFILFYIRSYVLKYGLNYSSWSSNEELKERLAWYED